MTQIKGCAPGCTCGKHRSRPCEPGCACSRHSLPFKFGKCPDGCTCGRHKSKACAPGCTCGRHGASVNKGAKCPDGCTCKRHTPPKRPKRTREEQLAVDRERRRQQVAADPEKNREACRNWYVKNPYWSKYRMTVRQWEHAFTQQEGLCYLCGDQLRRGDSRAIHVDHDHRCCPTEKTCGKCIRGLTCSDCNSGIGDFGEDPELMLLVAARLESAIRAMEAR